MAVKLVFRLFSPLGKHLNVLFFPPSLKEVPFILCPAREYILCSNLLDRVVIFIMEAGQRDEVTPSSDPEL